MPVTDEAGLQRVYVGRDETITGGEAGEHTNGKISRASFRFGTETRIHDIKSGSCCVSRPVNCKCFSEPVTILQNLRVDF